MGLRMAAPVRHSKSGIFWFRRRVPADLVALVGRKELKFSLETRDPSEARTAYSRVSSEVEARWAALRAGGQKLTHKEMEALAGEYYRALVAEHEDDPPEVEDSEWERMFDSIVGDWSTMKIHRLGGTPEGTVRPAEKLRQAAIERRRETVQTFLLDRGIVVRPDDLDRLVEIVSRAARQGRDQVIRYKQGDYRADPDADRFPPWERKQAKAADTEPEPGWHDLVAIYEAYALERDHSLSTRKKWRPIIAEVAAVHADVRTITPIWCVQWKDGLLKRGLSTKSVQEGYLAALRSTLAWAVGNKRLDANPMDKIVVRVNRKGKKRDPGYTDDEALFVLGATLKPVVGKHGIWTRRARRWVPWLCAYSGARVGEIAQLRKEDVKKRFGVWLLWVTPEAGTVKDSNSRWVALHEHVIKQGFLDFVASLKPGPIFHNHVRPRGGSEENPLSAKVGERLASWLREEGMIEEVQPNHAWRHKFKTDARIYGIDPGTRDYLQGHAPASEGEGYGNFPPPVLLAAISKLPSYNVPGLVLPTTTYQQPPPVVQKGVGLLPEVLGKTS